MKSGGAHVSTSCYLNPCLLYTMHTLRFHMILMHDQQNPLTTSNYMMYAPKHSCERERESGTYRDRQPLYQDKGEREWERVGHTEIDNHYTKTRERERNWEHMRRCETKRNIHYTETKEGDSEIDREKD